MNKPRKVLPSLERLDELFEYKDDALRHKCDSKCNRIGEIVGARNKRYAEVRVDGKGYKVHRIVWKIVHREEPPDVLDHIVRDQRNNSIDNLRASNPRDNYFNSDRYDSFPKEKQMSKRRRANRMKPHQLKKLKEQLGLS